MIPLRYTHLDDQVMNKSDRTISRGEYSLVSGSHFLKLQILCFIFEWCQGELYMTQNVDFVHQLWSMFSGNMQHFVHAFSITILFNIWLQFTCITGPLEIFWVSLKTFKLLYEWDITWALTSWTASLSSETPFSNSQRKTNLHRCCHKTKDVLSHWKRDTRKRPEKHYDKLFF